MSFKDDIVCVPMNLDAFILNQPVCDTGSSRIAPITQPDYLGLRPDNRQIRADILPHVDVTASQPASTNSRISATESLNPVVLDRNNPQSDATPAPPLRQNRVGVYLHWSLPRLYRAATSGAEGVRYAREQRVTGQNIHSTPSFRLVPNRWYIVRNIRSSVPEAAAAEKKRAWIVESDAVFNVSDLGPQVDLETDVSPYTTPNSTAPDLNAQSSIYVGSKYPAESWPEAVRTDTKRTGLTVMSSSNFCFADNTVHNPNVFSIVDNFEFQDSSGEIRHFRKVTCDYFVTGWHDDTFDDPLNPKEGMKGELSYRLHALFLTPPRKLDSFGSHQTICHGTIYNVQYDKDAKPDTPADGFADLFKPNSNITMEPVSVGTTALDSILSFLRAHEGDGDGPFEPGTGSVADDLLSLGQLLESSGDDFNSRVKASDLLFARNYTPSEGGRFWHFDGKASPGGAPARPGNTTLVDGTVASEVELLRLASDMQYKLDTSMRKLKHKRWEMFAIWWSFVSDTQNNDPQRISFYQNQLDKTRMEVLNLIIATDSGLQERIADITKGVTRVGDGAHIPAMVPARSVPQSTFFQRKDPTICLAGMDSGWPTEYTGYVPIRLANDIIVPGLATDLPGLRNPDSIPRACRLLFEEAFLPMEHQVPGFKEWNGQPWVPLYLEWEADYFHIPLEKWSVSLTSSPVDSTQTRVRYNVKESLFNAALDRRAVSGRAILTPNSGINLKALVDQVLTDPSVTLSGGEIEELKANVSKLKFSVAEMEGLTTNLLTLGQGTHMSPNFESSGNSQPITAAVAAGAPIGLIENDLKLIGGETALTPYGSLLDFSKATQSPFKGLTHGQVRFTKLNVIDKFGQVISAIPPNLPLREPNSLKPTIYPCLGDEVCPGLVPGTNQLNTITPITEVDQNIPGDYPLCPYIQLTPAINQEARLNASFVVPQFNSQSSFTSWRASDDWEQPVFAWVVANVADQALQFFTGEGIFFVEMALGGPSDTIKSPSWRPFNPPSNPSTLVSPQLQSLMEIMSHPRRGAIYLRSFWDMITQSLGSTPFTPASYGTYATSIIGKPFALVNAGFSLELALPPLTSSVIAPLQPPSSGPSDAEILFSQKFPIKIGDRDRPFDGVVGYLNTEPGALTTLWDKELFTYFTSTSPEPGDPRIAIQPENFDTLSPYYIHPETVSFANGTFTETHTAQLKIKTLLIDPYTPLHVYTPILPIKSLRLPDWTIQSALEKMNAFFRVGPVLLTQNLPIKYDPAKAVIANDWAQPQEMSSDAAAIRLPLSRKGKWKWLQPYVEEEGVPREGRKYNGFEVGEDGELMDLAKGPYTMVEGFLQLTRPPRGEDLV